MCTRQSWKIKKILEKPKKNFLTNTGLYIVKPEIKKYLPKKIILEWMR